MTDTDHQRQLQNALDRLDAAFAPLADLPIAVGGCTYCYPQADLDTLAGPPHAVSEDMVASVSGEVSDHWDDFPGLYRRLLPRIARLLVGDRLLYDLVATRLLQADWRNWPQHESEALEAFLHAWWRSVLATHPCVGDITDILEVLGATTGTLVPFLNAWADTRTVAADKHLYDMLDWWLLEGTVAFLHLGHLDELHAAPELMPWLLALPCERLAPEHREDLDVMVKHVWSVTDNALRPDMRS
ncbi:hypothetical protein GCM10019016_103710 [Streptomyces prasinosporus]|uniref:Uncharacterized protein n=1 Tax=Streptomyces prasinosporus TaxID=68256 RepID=A0ABP6UAL6_9ACTN